MKTLVVLEDPKDWPLRVPGVEVVSARAYLVLQQYGDMKAARVFNLCTSYRYQSLGYYVSLIAEARGHKHLPAIQTIQDLKHSPIVRVVAQDTEEQIRRSLAKLKADTFTLSIYFGGNMAKRYEALSRSLYNQFPAPFLRASFRKREDGWELESIRPIAASEIPQEHKDFALLQAKRYFARPLREGPARKGDRYDLAILVNPDEAQPPSDSRAIKRFVKAAQGLGFGVELIDKDDVGRLGEFDALFIRETTSVNHHTFRFARRAAAEGLVVIDDAESILRCSNKVYIAELLEHHGVATPRTEVVSKETAASVPLALGFPCVVKQPDSAFSKGVVKAENERQFSAELDRMFRISELLIVQEWAPTEFDWRVGVIDGQPLYVCRYHMAQNHWQILGRTSHGSYRFGRVDTLAVKDAPAHVVRLALRAARLIGRGLYGVDLKELNGRAVVIEINDNPNIDAGFEDRVLGEKLYRRIMEVFVHRLEAQRRSRR